MADNSQPLARFGSKPHADFPRIGTAANKNTFWAEVREAQRQVQDTLNNTGMAVLTDCGEEANIHSHSKDRVGLRLALLTRNMVYGETTLSCRRPRLQTAEKDGNLMRLTFIDTGSALSLKPEPDSAFELCEPNGNYVPATATLSDGKLLVSAKGIDAPQHVRYGWKQWFVPTLFNAERLPASPFCR